MVWGKFRVWGLDVGFGACLEVHGYLDAQFAVYE